MSNAKAIVRGARSARPVGKGSRSAWSGVWRRGPPPASLCGARWPGGFSPAQRGDKGRGV